MKGLEITEGGKCRKQIVSLVREVQHVAKLGAPDRYWIRMVDRTEPSNSW